jgi:alkylation response protein AidB-like acyl-CoA dehydrogenase
MKAATPIQSFAEPRAREFRQNVRDWLSRSIPAEWRGRDRLDEASMLQLQRFWDRSLFDAGYAGLTWPVEYGGRGLGAIEEFIFHEEGDRADAPEGSGRVGRVLVGPALIKHGTPEQHSRYLDKILTGEHVWCQGFSEPNAGSDLAALQTEAQWDGRVYVVNGQKVWTSYAMDADRCLLLARTSREAPRHHNITAFLMDMRQAEVVVSPIKQISGDNDFNQLQISGATVRPEDRLGDQEGGWRVAMDALNSERGTIMVLRYYYPFLTRAFDRLAHCVTQADGQQQARATALGTRFHILRWHLLRSTELLAAGRPADGPLSILKLFATELSQATCALGLGVACEEHLGFWRYCYLKSRGQTIGAGTSEIQRNMIAQRVLQLPK